MKTPFVAFLLACLTISGLYGLLMFTSYRPAEIIISGKADLDLDQTIKAINDLHLKDVIIAKAVNDPPSFELWLHSCLGGGLMLALMTGLILFFYKLYCRWMKITPRL